MNISLLLNPAPATDTIPNGSAASRAPATVLPPAAWFVAEPSSSHHAPNAPHFAEHQCQQGHHHHHHGHAHHHYGYASHPGQAPPHHHAQPYQQQPPFQPVYSHAHPHAAVHRDDTLSFFKMSTPPQSPPTTLAVPQGAATGKKMVRAVAPRSEPLPAPVTRAPVPRAVTSLPTPVASRSDSDEADHEHPAELSDDGSSSGSTTGNAPCELSREERAQLSAQWWSSGCSSKWSHLFCPWNDCLEDFDGEPAYHVVKHLHYYYVECPFCNYKQERNTSKHKIVSHLQRHLAPVYRCACGRTYSQKQTYVRHIRELRCTAAPSARTPTKRPSTQGVAVWRLIN